MTRSILLKNYATRILLAFLLLLNFADSKAQVNFGPVNCGSLLQNLFVFTDAHTDANWQGATKGFIGDVSVNGIVAAERTSGNVPYSGTIYTSDNSLGAWENIVNSNSSQANRSVNENSRIDALVNDLEYAFWQINNLPVTPGFESRSSGSLNNLNTVNGRADVTIINITSELKVSSKIYITGDANDLFILRWDEDANFSNGYNGQVKFQSGGAIVPQGELIPTNFINVAGDINSSGGGSNPSAPYPQGPRTDNGTGSLINGASNFNGGGFFTGYWLTTGKPTIFPGNNLQPYGETSSLSNGIFVGGWYSKTTKFSMTSGTSGVYVAPAVSSGITPTRRGGQPGVDQGNHNTTPVTVSNPSSNNNSKTIRGTEPGIAGLSISKAYPSPFMSNLNVTIQSEREMTVMIKIFDNTGHMITSRKSTVNAGYNQVKIENLDRLAKGLYFVRIETPEGVVSSSIFK